METHREWEEETRESRQELAEGKGVTFPNAQEAKRWLLEEESDKGDKNMKDSHDMDDMGEWVIIPYPFPCTTETLSFKEIGAYIHAELLDMSLVEYAEIWRALS